MAKKIINLVVVMAIVLGVTASAEAATRVYYRPAYRRVIVYRPAPRRVVYRHHHHHNRIGAFVAGAVIGAILAR